jgi:serine protease
MNKKLITALVALTLIVPATTYAAPLQNRTVSVPTIAILDTAIDTSLPVLKDKIIYEACVTQWSSCPNGQAVMEGTGSATLPQPAILQNGFDHGTQMAVIAVNNNPNIRIVFVRIIGINSWGGRQAAGEQTVYNGLQWVIDNQSKFNIQAVSMSQGHHNLLPLNEYCPVTPTTESKVKTLKDMGIPVFFPAGNQRDYAKIDWPACIPDSIAVSATMPTKEIAIYTNFDPKLTDFFAQGTTTSLRPGGQKINVAGTSASTVTAATQWATIKSIKPTLSYSQIYDLISRTSLPTKNSKITGGKLINLQGAING